MSGPRRYQRQPGSWRIVAIAALGISVVVGIVVLRYYRGDAGRVAGRMQNVETAAGMADALQELQAVQRQVIDELQMTRERVTAHEQHIRKLTFELQDMTQKLDALRNAFASEPSPGSGSPAPARR
jgi:uncharacterized coiled-coil protein SlyX